MATNNRFSSEEDIVGFKEAQVQLNTLISDYSSSNNLSYSEAVNVMIEKGLLK